MADHVRRGVTPRPDDNLHVLTEGIEESEQTIGGLAGFEAPLDTFRLGVRKMAK
jgi:hypothetical protein